MEFRNSMSLGSLLAGIAFSNASLGLVIQWPQPWRLLDLVMVV